MSGAPGPQHTHGSGAGVQVGEGTDLSSRYAVVVSFGVVLNGTTLDDIARRAGVNATSTDILDTLVRRALPPATARLLHVSACARSSFSDQFHCSSRGSLTITSSSSDLPSLDGCAHTSFSEQNPGPYIFYFPS